MFLKRMGGAAVYRTYIRIVRDAEIPEITHDELISLEIVYDREKSSQKCSIASEETRAVLIGATEIIGYKVRANL